MHILLIFSVFLTVVSSSLLTLIFENKKIYKAICYFGAILFAQVVLIYEILSIFSLIKPKNVIISNILITVVTLILFYFKGKNFDFYKEIQFEISHLKKAISSDKWLKAAGIAFILFIAGSLIFMYFMPINDEDALSYHVARLPFWYDFRNINHFITSDIRALIMPINSEIFYFWAYSFIKSDIFVRLFSFLSYILFGAALRGFLKTLGYPLKTFLWVFGGLSAMQSVMFSITGTETNITIAALLLSSLFLFIYAVKNDELSPLYFSSLLYALAIGTKTPSLMAMPAMFIIAVFSAFIYRKSNFYKPILILTVFCIFNFLIFASYNYILNFLDFGNPFTSVSGAQMHRFYGGIEGFFANIIRYATMFFDFTGMPFGVQIWRLVISFSMFIMAILGIQPDINIIIPDTKYFESGNNFENMCGLGVLSFLLFVPSIVIAIKRIKTSKRALILGTLAIGFLINLVVLSASLGYMIFSVRFVMFFVMLASPVMVYMFLRRNNHGYKKLIALIMIFSFTFSYYFYERRFAPYLIYIFYKNPSVQKFKKQILCANVDFDEPSQACRLVKIIEKQPGNLLYFASSGTNIYYPKHSENSQYNVDFALLETSDEQNINWDKYTYIAVPNTQLNTNVQRFLMFKNAIKIIQNYDNKIIYEYNPELFANCNFVNFRFPDKQLLIEDEHNITSSRCQHKPEILKKYGFHLIEKIDNYDKTPEDQINLYKKMKKYTTSKK